MKIYLKIFYIIFLLWAQTAFSIITDIRVDANRDLGPFTMRIGTNAGPMSIKGEMDLTAIYRELGFSAIRTHDYYGPCDWYTIFPDWNKNPQDPASYNFSSTDTLIKQITDSDFQVLFRIGPSWNDPIKPYHSDPPGTIRDDYGNIIHHADQNDFEKFAEICRRIVMHYNEGWANGYSLGIKKWEIWNEPSLATQFWSGTPLQFFQMFSAVAAKLKNHDSSLMIGGPGLAGGAKQVYRDELIVYCAQNTVPLDFFSWHCYGRKDEVQTPVMFAERAQYLRALLDANGYTKTQLFCDEWNAGLNAANFVDTERGAAFYVCALTYLLENGISECYQYRGDNHGLGLVLPNGHLKFAAEALKTWKFFSENNSRIHVTGTDTLGFTAVAAASANPIKYWVLLSNFPDQRRDVHLKLENAITTFGDGWEIVRKTLKMGTNWVTADSIFSEEAETSFDMRPESVQLVQISRIKKRTPVSPMDEDSTKVFFGNFPNPFNEATTIIYDSSCPIHDIRLQIVDVLGREIFSLCKNDYLKEKFTFNFLTNQLASGTYFMRLRLDDHMLYNKMLLAR